MNRQLDAVAADLLRREVERLGLSVRLSDSIAEVVGGDSVERLRLRSSEIIPCDTLVVATSAADGKIMDCVKRQMSQWRFSFPDGGPVRVERPFRF